jgi:hypothetical protein
MNYKTHCPARSACRRFLGPGLVCAGAALAMCLLTESWRSGLACAALLALFWVQVELKAGNEQPLEP